MTSFSFKIPTFVTIFHPSPAPGSAPQTLAARWPTGLGQSREEGAGSREWGAGWVCRGPGRGKASSRGGTRRSATPAPTWLRLCAQPRGDRHVTLLPSSFLADTPGDGISAPLRRRCRGRRRRGWRGGLRAGPDSLFPGGGRGVFRGSRGAGEAAGVPGSGRARSGDPWPRLARVGRGRRSLRWEAAARVIPSSRAPFRTSCPLLQPAARPPRGHVDAGLVWPRRPGGGLGAGRRHGAARRSRAVPGVAQIPGPAACVPRSGTWGRRFSRGQEPLAAVTTFPLSP